MLATCDPISSTKISCYTLPTCISPQDSWLINCWVDIYTPHLFFPMFQWFASTKTHTFFSLPVRSVRGDDELHHEYDDESISDVGTLEVGVWCVGLRVGGGVEEFVVWYRGGSYICVDKNWETDTGKWWFGVVFGGPCWYCKKAWSVVCWFDFFPEWLSAVLAKGACFDDEFGSLVWNAPCMVNKNTCIHCFSNGGVLLNLAMCDVLDRIRLFLGHLAMAFGCIFFLVILVLHAHTARVFQWNFWKLLPLKALQIQMFPHKKSRFSGSGTLP